MNEVVDQADPALDGRSTRWEQHRIAKRRELVQSTLRAIRKHGAGVGLDEIAAQAGTSKTVIYRHFGDRAGLWAAVVESVHAYILSNFDAPLNTSSLDPIRLVLGLADAYLGVVERDPEIYRFVVTRPTGETTVNDPVGSFTSRIGALTADNIRTHLRATGYPNDQLGLADTWGHGVVGFIWAVADAWLADGMRRPRADILSDISRLVTPVLTPLAISPLAATENEVPVQ